MYQFDFSGISAKEFVQKPEVIEEELCTQHNFCHKKIPAAFTAFAVLLSETPLYSILVSQRLLNSWMRFSKKWHFRSYAIILLVPEKHATTIGLP